MGAAARKKINAQQSLEAMLDAIESKYGRLTPSVVVREARSPAHPLHRRFVWDDKRAGEIQRLNTARALIRSVRFVVQVETFRFKPPTFAHDPAIPRNQQGYAKIAYIKTEAEQSQELMDQEMERAAGALRRARLIATALGEDAELRRISKALKAIGRF